MSETASHYTRSHELMETVDEVIAELRRAMTRFPTWPTDPLHAVAVLNEEVGELNKAILEATYTPEAAGAEHVHAEAVQVAAMALRFLTAWPDYRYLRSDQLTQAAVVKGAA